MRVYVVTYVQRLTAVRETVGRITSFAGQFGNPGIKRAVADPTDLAKTLVESRFPLVF